MRGHSLEIISLFCRPCRPRNGGGLAALICTALISNITYVREIRGDSQKTQLNVIDDLRNYINYNLGYQVYLIEAQIYARTMKISTKST